MSFRTNPTQVARIAMFRLPRVRKTNVFGTVMLTSELGTIGGREERCDARHEYHHRQRELGILSW